MITKYHSFSHMTSAMSFNSSSDSPIMELYYIVLSLPLCIVLFSHNTLYIPVLLLLLNKLSFNHSSVLPYVSRNSIAPGALPSFRPAIALAISAMVGISSRLVLVMRCGMLSFPTSLTSVYGCVFVGIFVCCTGRSSTAVF